MTWDPSRGYAGSLSGLFELMGRFMPSVVHLRDAHHMLVDDIHAIPTSGFKLFVCRYNRTLLSCPGIRLSVCSELYQVGPTMIVLTTDNEATASLYEAVRNWGKYNRADSIEALLADEVVVTGMRKPKGKDVPTDHQVFPSQFVFAAKMLDSSSVVKNARESLRKTYDLKYSHLAAANPADKLQGFANITDELRVLTYRCLCPINVFPTPKRNVFVHEVAEERLLQKDIGETYVRHMAAFQRHRIISHLGNDEGRRLWDDYDRNCMSDLCMTDEEMNPLNHQASEMSCSIRRRDIGCKGKRIAETKTPPPAIDEKGTLRCIYVGSMNSWNNWFSEDDETIIWKTDSRGWGFAQKSRIHGQNAVLVNCDGITLGLYALGRSQNSDSFSCELTRIASLDRNYRNKAGSPYGFVLTIEEDQQVSADVQPTE